MCRAALESAVSDHDSVPGHDLEALGVRRWIRPDDVVEIDAVEQDVCLGTGAVSDDVLIWGSEFSAGPTSPPMTLMLLADVMKILLARTFRNVTSSAPCFTYQLLPAIVTSRISRWLAWIVSSPVKVTIAPEAGRKITSSGAVFDGSGLTSCPG